MQCDADGGVDVDRNLPDSILGILPDARSNRSRCLINTLCIMGLYLATEYTQNYSWLLVIGMCYFVLLLRRIQSTLGGFLAQYQD